VTGGPDFLLIGAAKSGTTALYHALRAHPDIFMPDNKEPHYFAFPEGPLSFGGPRDHERHRRTITNRQAYLDLFAPRRPAQIAGEASTYYLYSPLAPARIRDAAPRARIVAILREPAERAFANYLHLARQGFETAPTFADALAREPARIAAGWDFFWRYRDMGFYHRQLSRYFDCFERDRMAVVLYDDFRRDPGGVVRRLYGFLEVDPSFVPDLARWFNRSGVPTSRRFQRFLTSPPPWIRRWARRWLTAEQRQRLGEGLSRANLRRPDRPTADLDALRLDYRADLEDLERLAGLDLSGWLRRAPA
jgi:hypothetical protein